MRHNNKELIVVGDRVLVRLEEGEERTNVGLYLPPTAVDNQAVQGGEIVATGPGLPMPSPDSNVDEPWRMTTREIFTTYFARGYRAMEFFLDRDAKKGTYLLTRK